MEPVNVNNNINDHSSLRAFYFIGLWLGLVFIVLLLFLVGLMVGYGANSKASLFIAYFIMTVIVDIVGWIGYISRYTCFVVMYGIALFVTNVYFLASIMEWEVNLLPIMSVIRVSFSIPVLGYAYSLIANRRMKHVERSDEAHSTELMNFNKEASH